MIISHSWVSQHLDDPDVVILDSRSKVAYSYAHILNSHLLGIEQVVKTNQYGVHLVPDEKDASSTFASVGIDGTKTVIVYGDYLDPAAARVAWTLLYFGHEKTKIMDIGIRGWHQEGLPITRVPSKKKTANFVAKINSSLKLDADKLQKKLESVFILDARAPQEYMAGRIPNAVLVPFTDGVGKNGLLFKGKDELVKLFKEKQIPKDKELVCYCTLGHRGANLFLQLKIAGYENVKLYDGSFADWVGRRLPVE